MFHSCQSSIHRVSNKVSRCSSEQQAKLTRNIVSSLAREVQDLSGQFRKSQSDYLDSKSYDDDDTYTSSQLN